MTRIPFRLLFSIAFVASAPISARGDTGVLADQVHVAVARDQVVFIDGRNGQRRTEELDLHERVLRTNSKGVVGIALTDERLMAFSAATATLRQTRVSCSKVPAIEPIVEGRVALVPTNDRIIGFVGPTGNLIEAKLGLYEMVKNCRAGQNVAVAVTDERAIGLSAFGENLVEIDLGLHEQVEGVFASADSATVSTNERLLIFQARSGVWSEQRL